MANRSLWPEGVEVHQRHLEFDTGERVSADKQEMLDLSSRGVASGLAVTINGGDNTKIDIALGYGYISTGDIVRLTANQTAVSLALNTVGTQNYVLLMYDEVLSSPEAHETDGTTRQTKATETPRVVVLTAAQYAALPATDAVLSNNAKDRALLVAIVVATGGALSGAAVQSPTNFEAALQTNQPTNITGLLVINIDPTTAVGTGTLSFNGTSKVITWQAPGEGSPGAGATLTTTGVVTLTSSGGKTILLNVTFSLLPSVNKTDSITVTNIYSQAIPRLTAVDGFHRSMIGSGVPSTANPHGLTLEDLAPGNSGTLEGHQDLEHANGIIRTSNPLVLSSSVNAAPTPDTLSLVNFSTGDAAYVNGRKIESLVTSTTMTFLDGSVEPGTYGIYLGQDANLLKQLIARFPDIGGGPSLLYDKVQILDVVGMGPGTYNLSWTSGGLLSWNGGPTVAATTINHIIRLYNVNRVGYLDVYIKGGATPGTTQTDAITILAPPLAEETIPLANVPWTGSALGFLGYGFGTGNSPNGTFDKRLFGTLSEIETRLDSGMINAARLEQELLGSGIIVRSRTQSGTTNNEVTVATALADAFTLGTLSMPNITVTGGAVYLGGRRLDVPTTALTMQNNQTNAIYIDANAVIQTSILAWPAIIAAQVGQPILRLWEEIIVSNAETVRNDLREYVGHKRDAAMGVVALNVNKQAAIAATSGTALTVTGGSASAGLTAVGGTSNGPAVTASASGSGKAFKSTSGDAELPSANYYTYATAKTGSVIAMAQQIRTSAPEDNARAAIFNTTGASDNSVSYWKITGSETDGGVPAGLEAQLHIPAGATITGISANIYSDFFGAVDIQMYFSAAVMTKSSTHFTPTIILAHVGLPYPVAGFQWVSSDPVSVAVGESDATLVVRWANANGDNISTHKLYAIRATYTFTKVLPNT